MTDPMRKTRDAVALKERMRISMKFLPGFVTRLTEPVGLPGYYLTVFVLSSRGYSFRSF